MNKTVTLRQIQAALEAECLTPEMSLDRTVEMACSSDLMSDVLAFSRPKSLLLTGLVTTQTVRTAEVADLLGICFVFGKKPTTETVEMAVDSGIPIFCTPFSLFTASGKLYNLGIPGCHDQT
jgi:hypothetical protein